MISNARNRRDLEKWFLTGGLSEGYDGGAIGGDAAIRRSRGRTIYTALGGLGVGLEGVEQHAGLSYTWSQRHL